MILTPEQVEAISKQLPSEEECHPGISIECVVFGYHNKELKVLCTRSHDLKYWYLPTGHIKKKEGIEEAANRILKERTGVKDLFLKQFHAYGNENRSLRESEFAAQLSQLPLPIRKKIDWTIKNRFVSICYYALVEFSKVVPQIDFFSTEWAWVEVQELPPMILDHQQIIKEALKTIRRELHYEPIGMNLLEDKFTLSEIQALYETILGRKLDTRNFIKKLVSLEIVSKTNEKRRHGSHRPPNLYKFNKKTYSKALKQEFELVF